MPLKIVFLRPQSWIFDYPPFLLKHDYCRQAHWITKRLLGSSSSGPAVPQNRNQKGSLLRKTSENPMDPPPPPHVAPWSHAEVVEEGPLRTPLKSKSPTKKSLYQGLCLSEGDCSLQISLKSESRAVYKTGERHLQDLSMHHYYVPADYLLL